MLPLRVVLAMADMEGCGLTVWLVVWLNAQMMVQMCVKKLRLCEVEGVGEMHLYDGLFSGAVEGWFCCESPGCVSGD